MNGLHQIIRGLGCCSWIKLPTKVNDFCLGQCNVFTFLRQHYQPKSGLQTYWFHAASMGEYAVIRPIIKKLKQSPCNIVVTFFSSTGVKGVSPDKENIDCVTYLPLDTPKNVANFLEIIHPNVAVFSVSELWFNYLSVLKQRHIPTYLISAIIRKPSKYFAWYGKIFRQSLRCFSHIFVLDHPSKKHLAQLGIHHITVSGDPLFDNAYQNAQKIWQNTIIQRFCLHNDIFVAGSISDENDVRLMAHLVQKFPDIKFLMVPHEINPSALSSLKSSLKTSVICYNECNDATDFNRYQVLIVDLLGILPFLYRYAKWAYVGGGFTPYLHSVIEATVYGVPVAFGPRIERKITPQQMLQLKIGEKVANEHQLAHWLGMYRDWNDGLERIKQTSSQYVQSNIGATNTIVNILQHER